METETVIVDSDEQAEPRSKGAWIWSEFKFFATLGVFIVAFITLVWGHFKIPSESMQPTLEVGDHLYVSKYAYGYSKHSLPYMLHKLPLPEGRIFSKLPDRGDVVVFRLPGMEEGFVIYERDDTHPLDNTPVFIIPDKSLFFMGDNRDNSVDSRAVDHGPGIVHMNYVMGRADRVEKALTTLDLKSMEAYSTLKYKTGESWQIVIFQR